MKRNKLIAIIMVIASLAFISSCEFKSDKSKIAATMRAYVEPNLAEGETFGFIGLSNRRDTMFMGVTRPCAGVIYTVTDSESGEKTRHFADVIFSNDYKTALCVNELDFDPIEFAKDKVKEQFKEKLMEKFIEKLDK